MDGCRAERVRSAVNHLPVPVEVSCSCGHDTTVACSSLLSISTLNANVVQVYYPPTMLQISKAKTLQSGQPRSFNPLTRMEFLFLGTEALETLWVDTEQVAWLV